MRRLALLLLAMPSLALAQDVPYLYTPPSGTNSGTNTGDVTIGAFGASPDAKGITISGQVVTGQPADATHPGLLSAADWVTFNAKVAATRSIGTGTATTTGLSGGGDLSADRSLVCADASATSQGCVTTAAQSFTGAKTFNVGLIARDVTIGVVSGVVSSSTYLAYRANVANGASSVSQYVSSNITLSASARIMAWYKDLEVTVVHDFRADGAQYHISGTLETCSASTEGLEQVDIAAGVATAHRTRKCLCTSDGASAYKWQNEVSATLGTTTTCAD